MMFCDAVPSRFRNMTLDPFTTLTSLLAEEIFRRKAALIVAPAATAGVFDYLNPPSPPPAPPRPRVDMESWKQAEATLTASLLAPLPLPKRVPGYLFYWDKFLQELEVGTQDVVSASMQVIWIFFYHDAY